MASTLLSVNNYYYRRGGADIVFIEHNAMLAAAGWSVVPFAMEHERNLPEAAAGDLVEEIELGSPHDGPLAKARKGLKAVYSFEARRKIGRLIDRTAPDICHAHNIYHHLSPSILPEVRRRGIPLVMTLHDLKIACPAYSMVAPDGVCERCRGGKLFNVLTNRCMKGSLALSALVMIESYLHRALRSYVDNVDCFIVPSRFYKTKLIEWGFPAERFEYVPNYVASASIAPRLQPGRRFVYFGRLSHEKGVATLLRAAAAAGVPVDIVGTGPLEAPLRQLAADLRCDARFLGFLSGERLYDAIGAARAVVVPSEWYENAPLSALEAGALGKPSIVADIGGLPEIADGSGWSFPSGDVEALAARLALVASLPDDAVEAAGALARRRIVEEFAPERYLDGIRRVYARLGVQWPGADARAPAQTGGRRGTRRATGGGPAYDLSSRETTAQRLASSEGGFD